MRKKISASLAVGVIGAMLALVTGTQTALADSQSINFETTQGYAIGSIDTQNGWAGSGGGAINTSYDQAVDTNTSGDPNLGAQSFRLSNGTTSGSFGDWPFSPSLTDAAGDSDGVGHGNGFVTDDSTLKKHFAVSLDVASATPGTLQPGLQFSVSPDRGDGARMSFLRFKDQADGMHIIFMDYQDTSPYGSVGNPANGCTDPVDGFVTTDLGPFNSSVAHTVKLSMDFVNGPHDDIVQVFVDGNLVHTGTSWEDYYRWCTESQTVTDGVGATRPVDSLIFQARTGGGPCLPSCTGNGYLIDNLSYTADNSPATIAVDDDGMATPTNCDATNPTFATIQAAVNDASAGDIIKVCPGNYPEHVTVGKQLTLDGAQAGNDARTHTAAPDSDVDSIVGASDGAFQVEANNVTIDGFTVQGVTSDLNAGIWTNPSFSSTDGGTQILNNVVQDNVIGIYLNNDGVIPSLVKHNLIQHNNESGPSGGTGIYSDVQLENATIDANKLQDNDNTAINLVQSGGSVVPVVVSNNTILNDGAIALFNSYGIDITHNTSTDANSSAVYIGGGDSDIHLDKNVLVNANGAGVEVANDFAAGPNSGVLVEHGGVRKNDQGVLLGNGGVSDTLQVHRVKIATTNTKGVVNNDAGNSVIDASENWWGRSSGPSDWGIGVGATTSEEVDFFPWALHPNFSAFQTCTINGTPGIDSLTGTPGKDVICGQGGDDTLKGMGGRDLLLGGDGNDLLQGGSANDALIGGNQDDQLVGSQGTDDTGQGRAGSDTCDVTTERQSTCE